MSLRNLISIGFLSAVGLASLSAQTLKMLTFDAGGGLSVPLNPTAGYFGVSGNALAGLGANFNKHNSIEGEFMWSGLSPTLSLVRPINTPTGDVNLFTLTGDYRFHVDSIGDSAFGVYVIGGGGWYYRHTGVDRRFFVPPLTVCQPIYNWWGFACDSDGFVRSVRVASHGSSAGGLNGGVGFTIRMGEGWKFFAEARYHYAWSNFLPTTLVPVSFGFRFN